MLGAGGKLMALTQERKPQHCLAAKRILAEGLPVTQRQCETFGKLFFMHPSPEPYCFQVAGPKAPWNQAVTTHEQEITRGTCRLSKDGSVGGPSLLPNNSPRCAANICAFRQQAEGSYRRTGPYLSNYKHMC